MKTNALIISCFIFFILLFIHPAFLLGQSGIISGLTINQTVIWSGQVHVNGDVVVGPSGILIIEPGTTVYFHAHTDKQKAGKDPTRCELIVQGVLLAKGEPSKKIVFTSAAQSPRMGDWYGISISGPKRGSEIEYAIVEYAYNGINLKNSNTPISNSQIHYNYYCGVLLEIRSNPKLTANIISENGYAGLVCRLDSNPVLADNIITLNQIGLIIFGKSKPNLGSLRRDEHYNIGRNEISGNQEYNIHNHSSEEIKAENNSWGTSNSNEIAGTIFDFENESKYGPVKFRPILGSRQDVGQRILGRQFAVTPEGTSLEGMPTAQDDSRTAGTTLPQIQEEVSALDSPVTQTSLAALQNESAGNQLVVENAQSTELELPQVDQSSADQTMALNNASETSKATDAQPVANEPPALQIDYEQVFLDVFLDEPKKISKKVSPQISDRRFGLDAKGDVIIKVVVNRLGKVESANVLKGLNHYYDDISLKAARQFEFRPGTVNGNPVRFSTVLFFKF